MAERLYNRLLRVRTEEPVPPRRLNPRIDPDLELVCLKCLEKRPQHRYPTAAALADDLEAYLKSDCRHEWTHSSAASMSPCPGQLSAQTSRAISPLGRRALIA